MGDHLWRFLEVIVERKPFKWHDRDLFSLPPYSQQGWLGYRRTTKAWRSASQKWRQNGNRPRRGETTWRRYTQSTSFYTAVTLSISNKDHGAMLCSTSLMVFTWPLSLPIGKEQHGNWPELQTEDLAAASGAGTNRTQGDTGTAYRQIWIYWRSQISCHEWYVISLSQHALLFCVFFLFAFSYVPHVTLPLLHLASLSFFICHVHHLMRLKWWYDLVTWWCCFAGLP